jgi:hypothetical protein
MDATAPRPYNNVGSEDDVTLLVNRRRSQTPRDRLGNRWSSDRWLAVRCGRVRRRDSAVHCLVGRPAVSRHQATPPNGRWRAGRTALLARLMRSDACESERESGRAP